MDSTFGTVEPMLKSGGRTNETPVIGVEEWPLVVCKNKCYSVAIGIASMTKRVAPGKE